MEELNPKDNLKVQKIYEGMLYKNFKKKEKPVEVKEKKKEKKASPWDQIKEDKYL